MKSNDISTNITKMDHIASYLIPFLLLAMDYLAILAAQKVSIFLRQHVGIFSEYAVMPNVPPLYFYFLIPTVFLVFLHSKEIYVNRAPFWEVIEKVFHAVICSIMVCITVLYFGHIAGGVSRIYVAILGIMSFIFLCTFRYILKKILFKANILLEPVLIIGAGKTAELVLREIGNDTGFGAKVVGFLDDAPVSAILPAKYPVLGGFADAEKIIKQTKVKTVIIAAPGLGKNKLLDMINRVQPLVKNLSFVPDLIGTPIGNVEIQRFYNARLMMLKMKNNMSRQYNRYLKRLFDIVVGGMIFLVLIPFLVIIGFFIKIDSQGKIFYNAKRIGKNNKEFICYKFRTMFNDSDKILTKYMETHPQAAKEWKVYKKIKYNDPRITKIGRSLRKFSIDELPQIINVIKGDMSLVGPRPYLPRERKEMGNYLDTIVKNMPGITGLWQVSGRNEIAFADRLKMDVWYIQNWSIWIDMVLLYKTIIMVLLRKGAY
ncbi:undecaprenyl-phosphate galactose phosphotransferase WbaP [Pectinatus sottacetonis]|uniref:undecaprenyl-phosphate galactose phosphotransferase WbaP n=1 Tax=Pectinatus sottacetonis TaxID=1002795 RepID=UPI0018C81034|nr:undecaprenyl-phosphate galactose phosphotransferase WbaP [Pectinatus sottacetonis]